MDPNLSKRAVNRQRWLERVTDWQQSGQSQKHFCEHHHLGLSTFQRWQRIFTTEQTSQASKAVTFLPVSVNAYQATHLNIVIDNNLRIDIPAGFNPDVLKQVLHVLKKP